jgi:hypothetical protein
LDAVISAAALRTPARDEQRARCRRGALVTGLREMRWRPTRPAGVAYASKRIARTAREIALPVARSWTARFVTGGLLPGGSRLG